MSNFANRLKQKLNEKEITQKHLADVIGTSQWTISQYVNGKGEPNEARFEKIAEILGCDVNWLKGIDEQMDDNDIKRNAEGYYDPTAYKAIKNADKGVARMEFRRGDIFYVERTGNEVGVEQRDGRPAVIVSNDVGNRHSYAVEIVYLTTKDKTPLPTHASVIGRVPCTALCEQVTTVSKDRLRDYVKTCTDAEMKEIDACLKISLGLVNNWDDAKTPDPAATVENSMIDDLKMKLEGAEKELDEQIAMLAEANERIAMLVKQNAEVHNSITERSVIELTTERDLYKTQYEMLLERLIGRQKGII